MTGSSLIVVPRTDQRLGRNVNHDERSRRFAFRPRRAVTDVKHVRKVPVWDQGQLGSCTGNAALGCAGTGKFYEPARLVQLSWEETDAVDVYAAATAIDPFEGTYPPQDTGSDGLSVAKVLQARGLIAGYQHAFSLDAALSALMEGPLIVGTYWYESMFEPVDGRLVVDESSGLAGGHEYIIDELRGGFVWMQNSWGSRWGAGGRAPIALPDFRSLLAREGDATLFTARSQPPPQPVPTPEDELLAAARSWLPHRHYGRNRAFAKSVGRWANTR